MAYPIIEKAGAWDRTYTLCLEGLGHGGAIETEYKITCAWGCGCCITVEELTAKRLDEHIAKLVESLKLAQQVRQEIEPGPVHLTAEQKMEGLG